MSVEEVLKELGFEQSDDWRASKGGPVWNNTNEGSIVQLTYDEVSSCKSPGDIVELIYNKGRSDYKQHVAKTFKDLVS